MIRLVGPALMVLGISHLVTVILGASEAIADIARLGLDDPVSVEAERLETFWGLLFGFLLLTVGYQVHWARSRTGGVPAFPGLVVAGLGLFGVGLAPISPGFWAMFLLGLAIVVHASRDRAPPKAPKVVAIPRRRRGAPSLP